MRPCRKQRHISKEQLDPRRWQKNSCDGRKELTNLRSVYLQMNGGASSASSIKT